MSIFSFNNEFNVFCMCREDALCLADKMKKITLADILESMEVSVTPFAVHSGDICSIYKLKMRLGKPGQYFKNSDITVEDCAHILEVVFLRELEDAIQNHLVLLSRISGIKIFMPDSRSNASNETDEDVYESRSRETENDDDTDDEERAEDLGLDAQKQKQQTTDEMDYEDGSEEEQNEGASLVGLESEIDMSEDENGTIENNVIGSDNNKDEISHSSPHLENRSKINSKEKKTRSEPKRKKMRGKFVRKETDRAIFNATRGLRFEVHFKLINEPHILLAQVLPLFFGHSS